MVKHKRGRPQDDPDDRPAPTVYSMWSTVQAAITGGWSHTFRLIIIMIVWIPIVTIMVILLGLRGATLIPAFLQAFR